MRWVSETGVSGNPKMPNLWNKGGEAKRPSPNFMLCVISTPVIVWLLNLYVKMN